MIDFKQLRQQYSDAGISKDSVSKNPFDQFRLWFDQALDCGIAEPNGFSLCTVSNDAKPSQRTVLMKSYDKHGFIFYTNYNSRKGRQLAENNAVSMLFPWYELHRQINIEGTAVRVGAKQSAAYFHSRPRGSQVGAWASRQSAVIASRQALVRQKQEIEHRFGDGELPWPDFWGGYRVEPSRFEFWQGRTHRLHDRIIYNRLDDDWEIQRLSP